MKYFDRESFNKLREHTSDDFMSNIGLFVMTFKHSQTPYYNKSFNLKISFAIIPNIIRLIKSAIWLALALPFCIITLGRFTNMNKIALMHFANLFVCLGNIGLSLVVPFIRNYYSWKSGYSYTHASDYRDKGAGIRYEDNLLKALTWQNSIFRQQNLPVQIDERVCLLSAAELYVCGRK